MFNTLSTVEDDPIKSHRLEVSPVFFGGGFQQCYRNNIARVHETLFVVVVWNELWLDWNTVCGYQAFIVLR